MKPPTGRRRLAPNIPTAGKPEVPSTGKANALPAGGTGWLSWNGPLLPSLASGILLWAAFPPLGWWLLVWIAPLGWLQLILRPRLSGRWPYLAIWLAGMIHWAAVVQGVRLAHPALYVGWLSMSAYLALYPLLFVGLTRVAVHRLGISIVISAPVVWTGLELLRGHALTGFSMALLGHTLFRQVALIQIADLGGAYAVSFAVMFVAACLARSLPRRVRQRAEPPVRQAWWPLAAVVVMLAGMLFYGRVSQRDLDAPNGPVAELNVALIQDSFDTVFEYDFQRERDVFASYLQLSRDAVLEQPELDLIVWPESAYAGTLGEVLVDHPLAVPSEVPLGEEEFRDAVQARQIAVDQKNRDVATTLNGLIRRNGGRDEGIWLIVGTDSQRIGSGTVERFNTVLLIDPQGNVASRYFKMHLVMFGEYIPFGRMIPLLYRLTPMTVGLTPGEKPTAFVTPRATIAPSICFESTVPHLIRRQVAALRRQGHAPDVLVNVTNDGWFWGSSILDLHLACGVFRAVENRLPFLVAANTGLSASVDQNGRIGREGPRRAKAVLLSRVRSVSWDSWYAWWGDVPAGCCLLFCFAVSIVGAVNWVRHRNMPESPE